MSLIAHSDHGVRAAGDHDGPVLAFRSTVLYTEDVETLSPGRWLTDSVLSLWWEHLAHEEFAASAADYVFMHPGAVAMCVHLGAGPHADPEDLFESLRGLALGERSLVFMPVNNNADPSRVRGGSHWSLLLWSRRDARFFHYDNAPGAPTRAVAARVAAAMWGVVLRGNLSIARGTPVPPIDEPRLPPASSAADCGVYVAFVANVVCLASGNVLNVAPLATPDEVGKYRGHMLCVVRRMVEEYAQLQGRSTVGRKIDPSAIRPRAAKDAEAPRAEDLEDVPLRDKRGRIVDMNSKSFG